MKGNRYVKNKSLYLTNDIFYDILCNDLTPVQLNEVTY